MRRGFTLVEVLVVIGLVAFLSTVVILALNPAELLKQSRDAARIADINTINKAVDVARTDLLLLGAVNTVYVSISDTSPTCANLGLPALPPGWSYACVTAANLRNTDGTGWIPVNFKGASMGSSVSALPKDPINTTSSRLYYAYATDAIGYEATAVMESKKFDLGGSGDVISGDGGTLASVYEKGTKLGLMPLDYGDISLKGYWTFDEGTGGIVYDYSGNNASGSWMGSGTHWALGKVGSGAGQFNGTTTADYVDAGNPTNLRITGNTITQTAWIFPQTNIVNGTIATKSNSYYFQDSSGNIASYQYGTTPAGYLYSTGVLPLNQWTFVAYAYNGSSITFFINGSPSGVIVKTGNITDSGDNFRIGWDIVVGGRYFNGLIDDVRIYNRALSAAEIAAIYKGNK